MMRRQVRLLVPVASATMAAVRRSLTPVDALTQLQLGITPPPATQRAFLLEYFTSELEQRGITEARLIAMDNRLCTSLLRSLVYSEYLAVPFRVYSFDVEFTGPPVFTANGPTEDITELGVYSPERDACFAQLVRPVHNRHVHKDVAAMTHITDDMLTSAQTFPCVWEQFLAFVNTPEPHELPGADARILLLSHGGKLADMSLIRWTLEKFGLELPGNFVFADTIHLIRDAHRRRPVTVDKHPPSWRLTDLIQWLHVTPTLPAHRAGNDAKMTWDALYHTLLRYGDDELTPREQLVARFFDAEAKQLMRARMLLRHHTRCAANDTTLVNVDQNATSVVTDAHNGTIVRSQGSSNVMDVGSVDDALDVNLDDIFRSDAGNNAALPFVPRTTRTRDGGVSADDAACVSASPP